LTFRPVRVRRALALFLCGLATAPRIVLALSFLLSVLLAPVPVAMLSWPVVHPLVRRAVPYFFLVVPAVMPQVLVVLFTSVAARAAAAVQ
jgi:hypothetical protein